MGTERCFVAAFPWVNESSRDSRSQFSFFEQKFHHHKPLQFDVPFTFRVGTLDAVMECSDELSKIDSQLEGISFKMLNYLHETSESASKRDVAELVTDGPGSPMSPASPGKPVEPKKKIRKSVCEYLQKWRWDDTVFPANRPIKQLIKAIQDKVISTDDVVRTKVGEYNEARTRLTNIVKKGSGNWSVRPIKNTVKDFYQKKRMDGPVESEYLTTLFVAVPKHDVKEWWSSYTKMTEELAKFTVPDSSDMIVDSPEYTIFSVVVFRKLVINFKNACRDRRWVVRDPEGDVDDSAIELENLRIDVDHKRNAVIRLLTTSFTECYTAWIHLKAIRVFVESVLRYGMPPAFTALLFMTDAKKEPNIRKSLLLLADKYIHRSGFNDEVHETNALESHLQYVSLKIGSPAA